jgi:hypothetical protein
MYLLVTARKGISSMQLAEEIGITQKSEWFVLHRLREACRPDLAKLQDIVEIDETYVGGTEKNKHESKKLKAGSGAGGYFSKIRLKRSTCRLDIHAASLNPTRKDVAAAIKKSEISS